MTRYQKYMNQIHDQALAMRIESAAFNLTHDIVDYLVKSGIKQDSEIITKILNFTKYEYKPEPIRTID